MFLANERGRFVYACPNLIRISGRDPTGRPLQERVVLGDQFLARRIHKRIFLEQLREIWFQVEAELPRGRFRVHTMAYGIDLTEGRFAVAVCLFESITL